MTAEAPAPKQGMPMWAKILIGFFVVGIIAIIAVVSIAGAFVANIAKQARDPATMARTANTIVQLQNPLPAGFKMNAAFAMAGITLASLEHEPEHTVYTLMKIPNPKEEDAKQLSHEMAERGAQGKSSSMTVTSEGTEPVAGEQMSWVQGESTGPNGLKAQQMVGVICPKGRHEAVLIVAVDQGKSFDMNITRQLLGAIKGF